MSTFLVTGAAGFIGSNIVHALLARGESVRGIDNFATGRRENLDGLEAMEFVEGDLTDLDTCRRVLDGVNYVLHQAAIPSVPRSMQEPLPTHHANVTATLTLLEAARQSGGIERLVYAASSSAYGTNPTLPKVETLRSIPMSPYGVAKLAGEMYARVYSHALGVECVMLRYFNVFGPRQDPASQYAAVIPKFIGCAQRGERPPVFGDGKQTRDFTYVDNVVEANLKACTAADVAGEVFNIGCGGRVDLLSLIDKINSAVGSNVEPELLPARPGDIRDSYADISKAQERLGYTAGVSLDEGLRRTVEWFGGPSPA